MAARNRQYRTRLWCDPYRTYNARPGVESTARTEPVAEQRVTHVCQNGHITREPRAARLPWRCPECGGPAVPTAPRQRDASTSSRPRPGVSGDGMHSTPHNGF